MNESSNYDRRKFLRSCAAAGAWLTARPVFSITRSDSPAGNELVLDPYAGVDWSGWTQYRAQLHMHTTQSDGHHMLDEVARCYKQAGYSILAITDHDSQFPNRADPPFHTPYPKDPKPENFPANTTWPWTDYGANVPEHYGMTGIEANELTYRNHINSFFCSTGFLRAQFDDLRPHSAAEWADMELETVRRDGGIAFLDHPGYTPTFHRHSLNWYQARFRRHPANTLIGIEVTNGSLETRPFDEGLWDQMLARFMPERPVWGFGTDDMHRLARVKQAFSLFPAPSRDPRVIRSAMESGRLLFCRSTNPMDYREDHFKGMDTYPEVISISTDPQAGTIAIDAREYDVIRWISAPGSLEATGDHNTDPDPFPLGTVVHEGPVLSYRSTKGIRNYVRAELIRHEGGASQHTYTNPFGFRQV